MAVLFAGIEQESFRRTAGGLPSVATNAAYYEAEFSRLAYAVTNVSGAMISPPFELEGDTIWLHFVYSGASTTAINDMIALSSGNQDVFRVARQSGANPPQRFQLFNGTSWAEFTSTPFLAGGNIAVYDVKIKFGPEGEFKLYTNGSLTYSWTGVFLTSTPIPDTVKLGFINNAPQSYFSQIIVADERTLGWKLYSLPPTGDGFHTDWDGNYLDVSGTNPPDTTYISSTADDQIELFTKAAVTIPANYSVKSLLVAARAVNLGDTPDKLQTVIRFGSTDYVHPTVHDIPEGYDAIQSQWIVNPATLLPWTPADAGSATVQFGLKSDS